MRRITEGDARSLDCSLFRLLYYGPGVLRDVGWAQSFKGS